MSAAQLQVQPFLPVGVVPFRPVSGAPLLEHFRAVDLVLVEEVGDPAAELPALQFRLRSRQVGGEFRVALRLPFENPADFPRQEFGREPLEVGPELRKDRFERPVDEVDQKRRVEIRGDPAGVPDAQLQPRRHALRLHHHRFGGENVGGQRAADERDELLRQPLEFVARIKVKFHKNSLAVTGGNIPERGLFFNPGRRIFAENPRRPRHAASFSSNRSAAAAGLVEGSCTMVRRASANSSGALRLSCAWDLVPLQPMKPMVGCSASSRATGFRLDVPDMDVETPLPPPGPDRVPERHPGGLQAFEPVVIGEGRIEIKQLPHDRPEGVVFVGVILLLPQRLLPRQRAEDQHPRFLADHRRERPFKLFRIHRSSSFGRAAG